MSSKKRNEKPAHELVSKWDHVGEAFAAWITGTAIALPMIVHLSDLLEPPSKTFYQANSGRFGFLLVYFTLLSVLRVLEHGSHALFELLWGCNMALKLVLVGLWTGRPLVAGTGVLIVATDQTGWSVDSLGYLLFRSFPLGVAKFLTWPETSFVKKVTTTHHLWFLPFAFSCLSGFGGLHVGSWYLSVALTAFLCAFCRVTTPKSMPLPNGQTIYLNINMGFEFWKDVQLGFLHACDGKWWPVYFAYLWWVGNLFNLVFFFGLRQIAIVVGIQ